MFPDLQFWSCPLTLSLFHFSDIYKTYFALECFNNFQKSDHLCPFWFFIFHQTALSPEWTLLYPKLSSALHKYSSAYIENLIKKSAESILVQLDPHWQNDHPHCLWREGNQKAANFRPFFSEDSFHAEGIPLEKNHILLLIYKNQNTNWLILCSKRCNYLHICRPNQR